MKRFDSVHMGLEAMDFVGSQRRKVGALLVFQGENKKLCQTCFLFESKEDEVSQLIYNFQDDLKIQGLAPHEVPNAMAHRQTVIGVVLAGVDHSFLGIEQFGHAEEFLIRNFEMAYSEVSQMWGIKNITIYLSHSPCTVNDTKPSNSLPLWPISCTAKFRHLAQKYPKHFFSIVYRKRFGILQGNDQPDKTLKKLSGNCRNLIFMYL